MRLFICFFVILVLPNVSFAQDNGKIDSVLILLKDLIQKKAVTKEPAIVLKSPLEKQTFRSGDSIYAIWDVRNLDSTSDSTLVKMEISFDNEASWENIGETELKKGLFKWGVKENINSGLCIIRCTPDDKSIKAGKSKRFIIKTQNDYINIGIGTNFNYADEQNRFSGIYFSINSSFPTLFKIGKQNVGMDMYFAQGFTSYYDSLYQFNADTNRISKVQKRDNRNLYAGATLYLALSKNWSVIMPHIEFRHTSSSLYIRKDSIHNYYIRLSNNTDSLIKVRDSSVFNQQSILTTNYFNGLGLAFNFQSDLFNINVKGLVGYDFGSKGFDYLVRFYLRNRVTGITIGGDLRGPFGGKTERFSLDPKPRVFEVLIYGSLDVDIFSTIKNNIKK